MFVIQLSYGTYIFFRVYLEQYIYKHVSLAKGPGESSIGVTPRVTIKMKSDECFEIKTSQILIINILIINIAKHYRIFRKLEKFIYTNLLPLTLIIRCFFPRQN